MATSVATPIVQELRDRIQRLEGAVARRRSVLPFGVKEIDRRLPEGGLALGALREVAGGKGAVDGAAAALFTAGIAARTRGGERQAVPLHALSAKPMEIHPNLECIERLHEEFKRRIKTQTVLPCAETAAMLFSALMASGLIVMRKVDGWRSLAEKPADQTIDLAA